MHEARPQKLASETNENAKMRRAMLDGLAGQLRGALDQGLDGPVQAALSRLIDKLDQIESSEPGSDGRDCSKRDNY